MNDYTKKLIVAALREHRLGYTPPAEELAALLLSCYEHYMVQRIELTAAREELRELRAQPSTEEDFEARLDEWREAMACELEALAHNVREGEAP